MSIKMFKIYFQFHHLIPILLSVTLALSSCSKKAEPCGDPSSASIQIDLVDKNDSLLIGKKYDPDSIKMNVEGKNVSIYIYEGHMEIDYSGFDIYNNRNYFLYLSKTDTDTLNLKVLSYENKCWSSYGFSGLTYNSKVISPVSYNKFLFKIIKE